jgi:DNA-binding MarR family transcriptional regulator
MAQNQSFDLRLFLPYLLNQAAEASSLSFQQVYKNRYGMLRAEWRVLFHLGVYGPLTAKDICDRAKMHKTKISRAVQKLADRRYLKRAPSELDRRSEILMLTERGQAVYRELNGIAEEYEADLLASFSSAERDVLKQLLVRLASGPALNDP